MNVYESWDGVGQRIIVDRQNGDLLIVIPERGDVVCMAAWHLPESATELLPPAVPDLDDRRASAG
jgi:hypothetical protein